MGRVVHFEIQVDDVERAKAFYGDVFGWTFVDWSAAVGGVTYWGVMTGEDDQQGINGGLLERATARSEGGANAYVCTVVVDDYDSTEAKILAAGGALTAPKSAMVGMAWQGYYLDPEGNAFGIHQPDPDAA